MQITVLISLLVKRKSIKESWSCESKGESRPEDIQLHALFNLARSSLSVIDKLATSLRVLTPVVHSPLSLKFSSGSAYALQ